MLTIVITNKANQDSLIKWCKAYGATRGPESEWFLRVVVEFRYNKGWWSSTVDNPSISREEEDLLRANIEHEFYSADVCDVEVESTYIMDGMITAIQRVCEDAIVRSNAVLTTRILSDKLMSEMQPAFCSLFVPSTPQKSHTLQGFGFDFSERPAGPSLKEMQKKEKNAIRRAGKHCKRK